MTSRKLPCFVGTLLMLGTVACSAPNEASPQDDLLQRKLDVQQLDPEKKPLQQVDREDENLYSGIDASVPEKLLARIRNDVAKMASVAPDSVRITSARPVVWPDGSLGCPIPDESYTTMEVPGFHVLAAVGIRKFDFRVAGDDDYRLCDFRNVHRPDIRQ